MKERFVLYSKPFTHIARKYELHYIPMTNPSNELIQLLKFLLAYYMPLWFAVKKNSSFIDGLKYVTKAIETSRYFAKYLQIVDSVMKRKTFFAHLENLLLAMLPYKIRKPVTTVFMKFETLIYLRS